MQKAVTFNIDIPLQRMDNSLKNKQKQELSGNTINYMLTH